MAYPVPRHAPQQQHGPLAIPQHSLSNLSTTMMCCDEQWSGSMLITGIGVGTSLQR
jgi:hypothetical protein